MQTSMARRVVLLLLLLGCALGGARAEDAAPPLDARTRDFDQEHLDLRIVPDLAQGTVAGDLRLTFRTLNAPLRTLRLHCENTEVQRVRDAKGQSLTHRLENGVLFIELAAELPADTRAVVQIQYTARPQRGLYFHAPCPKHPTRPHFMYSQGQGTDNRRWFPCYDQPDDRLSWDVWATVPSELETVSNGVRVAQEPSGPGLRTDHWRYDGRAPTYLLTLIVAKLSTVQTKWRDVTLEYSAMPGREQELEVSLRNTPAMMEFFSEYLSAPYPWSRYAQTFVWDFVYGGMENVTATTLNLRALHDGSGEPNYRSDGLVAHELAHMWFGDLLTCRTWEHMWLNEGFATYFTDLFFEHHYGQEEFLLSRRGQNRGYTSGSPKPEELKLERSARNDQPIELSGGKAYSRGAGVLHMLRRHLGDAVFQAALREYVRRNRDEPVVSEQLRRVMEDVSGESLSWFFDQWVYGVGYPRLKVRYDEGRKGLLVQQVQATAGGQGLFRMTLPVRSGRDGPVQMLQIHLAEHLFQMPAPNGFLRVGVGGDLLAVLDVEQSPQSWAAALEHDPDLTGRIDAAEALEAYGAVGVPALARALREDRAFSVRRAAAEVLAKVQGPGAATALLGGASDEDPRVRETVVSALGGTRRADAQPALLRAITDPHPNVRAAAARSIGQIKAEGALEALRGLLQTDSYNDVVRTGALDGLRQLGDPAGLSLARPYLNYEWGKGSNHNIRKAALDVVLALAPDSPDLALDLRALLDDPYHRMRAWAAEAAATYRVQSLRPRLEEMARDDIDGGAKGAAKTALERLAAPDPAK